MAELNMCTRSNMYRALATSLTCPIYLLAAVLTNYMACSMHLLNVTAVAKSLLLPATY